jgi:hypothetical protein
MVKCYDAIAMLTDFPKLHCPFLRQTFPVDPAAFREKGRSLGLRAPEVYLVVDRINPGYEWVFQDPDTFAVEKLNGTNIKILTEKGRLVELQNRKNVLDPQQILDGRTFILEGVLNAAGKGLVLPDGEQAGELLGPKVNGNPYRLDRHEWYPFDKAVENLRYKSFNEHERTFDNLSAWFKDFLFSRYYQKKQRREPGAEGEKAFAEGVVFYNLKRKADGQEWRAKLRRDMFAWFYERLPIQGYTPKGRDEAEDQDKFD